jgi:Zn-dependent protease
MPWTGGSRKALPSPCPRVVDAADAASLTLRDAVSYTPAMDVSNEQVRRALLSLVAFVLSVTVHEFGHAFVADRLGDGLPRAQGRVSLSPLRHIDPLGTIVIPLLAVFMSGVPFIAWGKPVQTNPSEMTPRLSRSTASLLVSLAGPLMNLVLAVTVSILLIVGAKTGLVGIDAATAIIRFVVVLNISLMFFNLLPIPPLDGAAILTVILPDRFRGALLVMRRWGMLVLMLLFATGVGAVLMEPAQIVAGAWGRFLLSFVPV